MGGGGPGRDDDRGPGRAGQVLGAAWVTTSKDQTSDPVAAGARPDPPPEWPRAKSWLSCHAWKSASLRQRV